MAPALAKTGSRKGETSRATATVRKSWFAK